MLESLVATILNRIVGSYVENFDPKQLNIGLLSGDVKLSNLTLKREALDKLHLPLNVVDGRIGSLVLQIPYSNFKSKPVRIIIEDVYMLAAPDFSASDDPDAQRRDLRQKLDKLAVWELAETAKYAELVKTLAGSQGDSDEDHSAAQQSYVGNLATKIIDNLQVTIKNIHIRYEDALAVPDHPFAMGVTLAELSAVSTDKNWEPAFISQVSSTTHKLATLDSFAVYWDTDAISYMKEDDTGKAVLATRFKDKITERSAADQYLLRPVNGQGFITLDKTPSQETVPKIHANLQFEEFGLGLDRGQYRDMLALGDEFQLYFRTRKFHKLRPKKTPKEAPMEWFRYAAEAVLNTVRESRRKWTWEYIQQHLKDMNEYRGLYKKKSIDGQLQGTEKTRFDELQSKYGYQDLMLARSVVKREMRAENPRFGLQVEAPKQQPGGWTSWIWGRGQAKPTHAADEVNEDKPLQISESDRKELYEALDLNDESLRSDVAANQILMQADIALNSGSIRIRQDPHVSNASVGSISFDGSKLKFVKRPDSYLLSLSLDTINIADLTQDSKFPDIVKVNEKHQQVQANSAPFFWLLFEHHPLDGLADSNLFLKSKSIDIVHNARFLESVVAFFKPPSGMNETVDAIISKANQTVEELREQTRAGLEYALEQHKTVNVKLDIEAPVIIIPLDPQLDDPPVTIIDAGYLSMTSDLVKREVLDEVKSKQATKYNENDWKQLEALMYDRFKISLHDTQILIGPSLKQTLQLLSASSSALHVLDKSKLEFLLELSIVPQNAGLARCRLSIKLPTLSMSLADVQYKQFMQTIDNAQLKSSAEDSPAAAELGEKHPLLARRSDSPDNVTLHDETPGAAEPTASGQRLFELSLAVDRVRLLLTRDWDGVPVLDASCFGTALKFWLESSQMGLDMYVSDILVKDLLNTAVPEASRRIVESEGIFESEPANDSDSTPAPQHKSGVEHLLTLKYTRQEVEDESRLQQNAEISLAALKFVLTPTTVVTLYDYVMSTFTSPDPATSLDDAQGSAPVGNRQTDTMNVKISMKGISAILNEEDIVISKLELASITMFVDIIGPVLKFHCVLGALTITDEIDKGSDVNSLIRQLASIEGGGDLADFKYENYGPDSSKGYNSLIYFRSGALKLSLVEEPLARLAQFFSRFAQMKSLYDQARMVAFNQAIQIESPDKIKFDVVVSSPILVFPRMAKSGFELLRFNLGEIYLQNSFEKLDGGSDIANHLTAGIRGIHIMSELNDQGFEKSTASNSMEMVHGADLGLDLTYVQGYRGLTRPAVVGESSFSPVTMKVTQYQYEFIMQLVAALTRIGGTVGGLEESEAGDLRKKLVDQKHLDKGQDQYWADRQEAATPSSSQVAESDQIEFKFTAPSFTLELYESTSPISTETELESAQLSSFYLEEAQLQLKLDQQNYMEVDATVKAFTVTDTRPNKENKFPHIVPLAKHEEHQLICRYTKNSKSAPVLNVSLDSPQIVLALDYLFAMQKFLKPAPRPVNNDHFDSDSELYSDVEGDDLSVSAGRSVTSASQQDENELSPPDQPLATTESMQLSVSVVDTYLTIIADTSNENSEAIVFKVDHAILQYGQSASLSLSKIAIFLTRMQKFKEDQVRLLDDFNITVSADNLDSTDQYSLTKVNANVEQLSIRLSLREILLATAIFNNASRLWANSDTVDASDGDGPKQKKSEYLVDGHRPLTRTTATKSAKLQSANSGIGGDDTPAGPRVSGEHLQGEFAGLHLVLIEPDHQIPFGEFRIKPFTINARNWSSNLRVDGSTELYSNIFNFSKSAWEPLFEKVGLGLNITRSSADTAPVIDFFTRNILNIEVTPTLLSMAQGIQQYINNSQEHMKDVFQSERSDIGFPYRIRNETGYRLRVVSDCANGSVNDSVLTIASGDEAKWFAYDWRTARENLHANAQDVTLAVELLDSGHDELRGVSVNLTGEKLYLLGPKASQEQTRVACEIYVKDYIKYVVFRSTVVILNSTAVDMEVRLVSNTADASHDNNPAVPLKAGEKYALPLSVVDSDIYVRPARELGYAWSTEPISWRSLRKDEQSIACMSNDGTSFFIQAAADFNQDIPLKEHYPYMNINLTPPFEIINNLPYDFDYRLYSRDTKQDWTNSIAKGATSHVHVVTRNHLLLLSVQVRDGGFRRSDFAIISSKDKQFEREDWLSMVNDDGQRLKLHIRYIEFARKRGLAIVIMAPYVILNNTGQKLTVSTRVNKAICHVTTIEVDSRVQRQGQPTLWSFDSPDAENKAMLRLDDAHWSSPVSFTAVGRVSEVALSSRNRQSSYHLGFQILEGEGRYRYTRVVNVTPRFMVNNQLDRVIKFREPGAVDTLDTLEPGKHKPVGFISNMSNRELCLSFTGENAAWSSSFVMSNIGTTYVRLYEKGKPTVLVKIEIALTGATLFMHLENAGGQWPYSIRNLTEMDFEFYQSNPFIDEDGIERKTFTPIRYHLPARSVMPYSWDFPGAQLKELVLEVGKKKRKVQLAEIGELPPAKFPVGQGQVALVNLSVVADGPLQALVISPYDSEDSYYDVSERPQNISRTASRVTVDGDQFKVPDVDDSRSATNVKLSLKGVGISYINHLNQELCYATFRHLVFKYRVSDVYQTLSWQCQWIQVDNALSANADFPVVMYPSVLPKSGEEMRQHPTFSGSVTRAVDDSYGLIYIKHATILLQEMTIEVDEDFLAAIIEMNRRPEDQMKLFHSTESKLSDDYLYLPTPYDETGQQDVYFEMLHLQPIQLNLSFARTGALSDSPFFVQLTGAASYMVDALTMAIGNIDDAPVKFNSLLMENVRTHPEHLLESIQTHYSQAMLSQVHRIVGSVDVLGSPVGLFNNISSGVMDLFYEPYLGYTMTDRPQDIGIGLAKGGASFVKKSVFGVSNSISKVTGSLSKALTMVTLDPSFQKQRRSARTRNHPRHALYGASMGATSFADSFVSGISGLARAPLEGAATDGAAGFFRGIGKGIIGLPTKTAVGVLDFASNLSEGVRNTTTLYDTNAITRARLPRVIPVDGVIRPYDERSAVGQAILHSVDENRYASDNYLAHTQVADGKTIVVSYQRVILVNMANMRRDWLVKYRELHSVIMEHSGLSLKLHDNIQGPFIPLPDPDSRRYIYKNIATAVTEFNQRRRVLY